MTPTYTSASHALRALTTQALSLLIGELPPECLAATDAEGHARIHYPELHPLESFLVPCVPPCPLAELLGDADRLLLSAMRGLARDIQAQSLVLAGCPSPVRSPQVSSFSAMQYGKGAGLRATLFFDVTHGREQIRFDTFAIPRGAVLPTFADRL